jgi:glucuronoarabinoxylan endo-1,4-beta-xylanase
MHGIRAFCAATLVASLLAQPSAQVTVSVDLGTRYQTIEGLGATGWTLRPWMENPDGSPFPQVVDMEANGFYDTLISQFGMTMLRIHIQGDIEVEPRVIDHPEVESQDFANIRGLAAAAERQNEPLRFSCTSWSPPAWMKVNESLGCGQGSAPPCNTTTCRIKDGMEPEVAGYFVRYIRLLKDSTGVDLFALGLQNEPAFTAAFPMCVMCPSVWRDVLKATGARFAQEGINTRIFGCEHMAHSFGVYEGAIRADEEAMGYMHAWAVHAYGDGVAADTTQFSHPPTDKPFWQTEVSGSGFGEYLRDWPKALLFGRHVLSYLRYSKASAYLWWALMKSVTSDPYTQNIKEFLMCNGKPSDKYYVFSHFCRFIRPGAQQILSSASDGNVRVVATYHDENECLSIVLINTGPATTVNLSGANLPATFEKMTSVRENPLQYSTVTSSEAVALPDSSIVTLVAGTYRGTGALDVDPGAPSLSRTYGTTAPASAVRMEILTLDGRRVGLLDPRRASDASLGRLPAGIYVRAFLDAHGRVVASSRLTVDGRK